MSITGHMKFFEQSKCLGKNGATISVSSGTPSADYALDQNTETAWRSSGSSDLSSEEVIIEFEEAAIDRLFLLGTNLKAFTIQYNNAGTWTSFASVVGIDGSKSGITETALAKAVAYYEFTEVTTDSIRIVATTTQTANEEKYLRQVIVTKEIGTLAGWPRVKNIEQTRNNRVVKTLSGFYSIQKSLEVPSFDLEFKDYPSTSTYNVDMDVMLELHDSEDPFLVWPCGGRSGSPYHQYTLRGWRLEDLYQMQISKALALAYSQNIFTAPINAKVELEAVI